MSTTTTTTTAPLTHSLTLIPTDYHIHHSRITEPATPPPPAPPLPQSQNPPNWPTNRRRIPPHRPVDPDRDQSTRRVYQSRTEQAFITVMWLGVRVNAGAAQIWRGVGGTKLWDFRYKIGGEF